MKPFPWRIGQARSNPSLRDCCGVSPLMMIPTIHSFIANHFLLDNTRYPGW
jgi:hypothetical protein